MSAFTSVTLARVCACRKFGTAIAARIAIMATTIRSSMSVNPFFFSCYSTPFYIDLYEIEISKSIKLFCTICQYFYIIDL